MTEVAVISDTHLPRGRRRLPPACVEAIERAELVLHAGDVMTVQALREIEAIGTPVIAVCGNVDEPELRRALPEERIVELPGGTVAMVHDAGPARGRLDRLRARFPAADAVVFGHSHLPLHERDGGFQIFNPGSPTARRRAPHHTMGRLTATAGAGLRFELVVVD
jgi:putative phosphoesterase